MVWYEAGVSAPTRFPFGQLAEWGILRGQAALVQDRKSIGEAIKRQIGKSLFTIGYCGLYPSDTLDLLGSLSGDPQK